jgi:hypothetical protein
MSTDPKVAPALPIQEHIPGINLDHVYTPAQLRERTAELKCSEFVIDGLIPK